MGLVSELRRRNVFRMAALYVVAAWLIMQVAEVLMALAKLPDWIGTTTLILLAVGFPIALVLSWFYELTPAGISLEKDVEAAESISRVTGRRLDFIVIALLCAGLLMFAYDKWWIGPPPEKSIAVLPFENMSGDPEQGYFSDGISEELLNVLAKLPGLRVAARPSSFQFKGRHEDIAEIAAQLNVAHILDGSVRKSGDRLRITAQLVKADDGYQLWSETYDRELGDVFAVQDEIAGAIGEALRVKLELVDGEGMAPTVVRTSSTAAYDAYLQGRELIRDRNRESTEAAIEKLERSLRLDEGFAPAHAQLAMATILLPSYKMSDRQEARRKALRHLDRAQELEPDLAEAHGVRALLAMYAEDPDAVVEHATKALAANPNYVDAMAWLINGLMALGRYDEADAVREQIRATDPLSDRARTMDIRQAGSPEEARDRADQLVAQNPSRGYQVYAWMAWNEGKLAEAMSWGLRASRSHTAVMEAFMLLREYDEARRVGGRWVWWVDIAERNWDEAVQIAQKLVQLYPDSVDIAYAAEIFYRAGRLDDALPLYERALELASEGEPIPAWSRHYTMQLALVRRKMGDEEGARDAADRVRRFYDEHGGRGMQDAFFGRGVQDAFVAAFEDDTDRAINALESAIRDDRLRWWPILDDPIFEDLWDDPRFIALRQELDEMLAEEHEKLLQLICFNNPVPNEWQPMPETCEGVAEKRAH